MSTREYRPHSAAPATCGRAAAHCGGTAVKVGLLQTASNGSPMPAHPIGMVEPVGLGVVDDISPEAPRRNSWSVSSGTVVLAGIVAIDDGVRRVLSRVRQEGGRGSEAVVVEGVVGGQRRVGRVGESEIHRVTRVLGRDGEGLDAAGRAQGCADAGERLHGDGSFARYARREQAPEQERGIGRDTDLHVAGGGSIG